MEAFKVISRLKDGNKVTNYVIAKDTIKARIIVKGIYGELLDRFTTVRLIRRKNVKRKR